MIQGVHKEGLYTAQCFFLILQCIRVCLVSREYLMALASV